MSTEIWREKRRLWIPALAFFLLNAVVAVGYRAANIGQRVNLQEQRLESRVAEEAAQAEKRKALETQVARVETNREQLKTLYGERLASQSERLTALIAEVRQLVAQAGLSLNRVSYPEENIEDHGLVRRSFVFNVEGSYASLRKLINSLELTESFLTLESIGLSEGSGSQGTRLRMSLRLSTLFVSEELAAALAEGGSST